MKIFKKKIIYLFLFIFFLFDAYPEEGSLLNPTNQEEALFLRRIAEFWQDGEMGIAKYQIENYINDNPKSALVDSLHALLGNIFMNEKNYSKAISAYDNIKKEDVKDKIAINLLACMHNLKWYSRLIDECDNYFEKVDGELKQKIAYLKAISLYNKSLSSSEDDEILQLTEKAKEQFENLLESKYENQAKEYLSQIHKNLNDYDQASKYYLDLAMLDPSKKDDHLFQAALLQAHFNKDEALNTFNRITDNLSTKSPDAAYNKLLLLFEMKRFLDIVEQKDKLLTLIAKDRKPLANFFIARAHFHLKDYENVLTSLTDVLQIKDLTKDQLKLSLIILMQSSFHLNDLKVFNSSFDTFTKEFPNDDQLFESMFAKGLLNKNNKNYEISLKDFENIEEQFEDSIKDDKFLFEYAHLLFLMDNTTKSRTKFNEFIENHPASPLIASSLSFIVNSCIRDLKNESDLIVVRNNLITEIENLLKREDLFSKEELTEFKYLLAKTHFDLESFDLSLNILTTLVKDKSSLTNEDLSETNLLIGFCHKNLDNNLHEFIKFAKLSLELNKNSTHKFSTYINLFNSYLSLAKEDESQAEQNLIKASNFLYRAYEITPKEISQNNILWLATFFTQKVKDYLLESYKHELKNSYQMTTFCKNAINLFNDLLTDKVNVTDENVLKLAFLYSQQTQLIQAREQLEKLVQNYRFNPEKNYYNKEEVIYELAKIYEKENGGKKAISLYEEFIPTFQKDSRFKFSSLLHLSRLELSTIDKDNLVISNKEFEKIISNLKTISFQKIFENEPTHLEAALDYVDVVCYMENKCNWEKRLFLLGRLKENFNSEEDIISQDYQTMKGELKDQDKLFNSYMSVVEVEKNISLGYLEKDREKISQAKQILKKLKNENLICTRYLENRISKNEKLIEEFAFEETQQ
ncbi:MAG: Outer membrane protein assembly factor BamD [Candidatus Anoxychlamydiales bacterium]|nr:Outer membrane protein assembly factor BamD [Candidatus Anoxychlamydiales bacterium]NGX35203.1 Outer membrane protein assembly factor BamD [Candidatus Anoxychlamydiales bacterium]